jgi:hypothetical protein
VSEFVSKYCGDQKCHVEGCDDPARHKVEEVVFYDDPFQSRHPLTAYICSKHFRLIMGSFGVAWTNAFRKETSEEKG